MGTPPDLPIEHLARASLSLALRLHAEGRTEEANAIFETLAGQIRRAGPVAVLIEGDAAAPHLDALVMIVQACAEEFSETRRDDGDKGG